VEQLLLRKISVPNPTLQIFNIYLPPVFASEHLIPLCWQGMH